MPELMLALGEYRFSIDTAAYQEQERASTYQWPEQPRLGRAPALQFTGKGGETIHLSGVIFPFYKGGFEQVDTMRAEAAKGVPLQMVSGLGDNLGRWCIIEIRERGTEFFFAGAPKKIDFGLTLRRYEEETNDTDAALAYGRNLRRLAADLTPPVLKPVGIGDIDLNAITNDLPAYTQVGIAPRQALESLKKIGQVLANVQQQSQAWKDAIAQVGMSVEQVQRGLLVDPAGTLRTILTTTNGLGAQRLPVLSTLVGPGLVAEASQVAGAMTLAQRTVGIVA